MEPTCSGRVAGEAAYGDLQQQQQRYCGKQALLPQRSPLSVLDALGSPYASGSEAGASPYPMTSPEMDEVGRVAGHHQGGISRDVAAGAHAGGDSSSEQLGHDVSGVAAAAPAGAAPAEARSPDARRMLQPLAQNKCTTPPKKAVVRRFFDTASDPASSRALPLTPGSGRTRQRSRIPRPGDIARKNSLNDNKVLLATKLKRTESVVSPALFQFAGHFDFMELLGSSKHSEVWKVRHRSTGELFAVKRCRRKFETRTDRERCMREIQAVAALPAHPNIVGQYRAWQQEGHFYIQMDVCEGGSLATLSQQYIEAGQLMPEELLWQVLSDVAQGLAFLHANGVLHLDVKPDNLYIDSAGTFKIGDFGLAWLREAWDEWQEGDGRYVAPELLRCGGDTSPSAAADVYSLGAALYECATGHLLPRSASDRDSGSVLLPHRSSPLQWLLQQMLAPEPGARPHAADIVMQVASLHGPVCPSPGLAQAFGSPPGAAAGASVHVALPPASPASADAGAAAAAAAAAAANALAADADAAMAAMRSPFASLADLPSTSLEDWVAATEGNGGGGAGPSSGGIIPGDLPPGPPAAALPPHHPHHHSHHAHHHHPHAALAGAASGINGVGGGLSFQPSFGGCSFTSRVASLMSLVSSASSSMADIAGSCGGGDWSDANGCGPHNGGGGLSFGQRLDAVANAGTSGGGAGGSGGGRCSFDDDDDDFGLPAVQPSATPECFGKRGGASRRSLLPPRAPSFSFDAMQYQQPARSRSRPVDIPPPTPGSRLARDMSMVSLADHQENSDGSLGGGSASDGGSGDDPVAPVRLFASANSVQTDVAGDGVSGGAGGARGDDLLRCPSFAIARCPSFAMAD